MIGKPSWVIIVRCVASQVVTDMEAITNTCGIVFFRGAVRTQTSMIVASSLF